jgi:pilus assembly protein Flp/PilA
MKELLSRLFQITSTAIKCSPSCDDKKVSAMKILRRFLQDESAATAIEYGLIAALVALVIITGVNAVGTKLSTKFVSLAASLK